MQVQKYTNIYFSHGIIGLIITFSRLEAVTFYLFTREVDSVVRYVQPGLFIILSDSMNSTLFKKARWLVTLCSCKYLICQPVFCDNPVWCQRITYTYNPRERGSRISNFEYIVNLTYFYIRNTECKSSQIQSNILIFWLWWHILIGDTKRNAELSFSKMISR